MNKLRSVSDALDLTEQEEQVLVDAVEERRKKTGEAYGFILAGVAMGVAGGRTFAEILRELRGK